MANTDAESVEDIVAARSKDVIIGKLMLDQCMPEIHQMNTPVNNAVSNTPAVDRTIPGERIGRMS